MQDYRIIILKIDNWRPTSLSKLAPMIFDMGLTHLGSEVSNLKVDFIEKFDNDNDS